MNFYFILSKSISESFGFRKLSLSVILLAGLLTGFETSPALVQNFGDGLSLLNKIVLLFFIFELVIRISAYGKQPWLFFKDNWNNFDFIVVVLCLIPLSESFAGVLRLVRVLRILRLLSAVPKLQLLTGALIKSFSSMGYVGSLLGLVCYIYGVAGFYLFRPYDPQHFGSLSLSLLTLFRVITLDNWSDIFLIVKAHSPFLAILYFITFILLGTMIMLNLVIGVIMNSMSATHEEMEARRPQKNFTEADWVTLKQTIASLQEQIIRLKKHAYLRQSLNKVEPEQKPL